MTYLENLRNFIDNNPQVRDDTKEALRSMIGRLRAIYSDALRSGAQAIDLDSFFHNVAVRNGAQPQTVYRLSLSELTDNLRKATVYGVITYFFRQFKFRNFLCSHARNERCERLSDALRAGRSPLTDPEVVRFGVALFDSPRSDRRAVLLGM